MTMEDLSGVIRSLLDTVHTPLPAYTADTVKVAEGHCSDPAGYCGDDSGSPTSQSIMACWEDQQGIPRS